MSSVPNDSGEYICFNLKDLNNELEKLAAVMTESQGTLASNSSDCRKSPVNIDSGTHPRHRLSPVASRNVSQGTRRPQTADCQRGMRFQDEEEFPREKDTHVRRKSQGKETRATHRQVSRPATAPSRQACVVQVQSDDLARESHSFPGPQTSRDFREASQRRRSEYDEFSDDETFDKPSSARTRERKKSPKEKKLKRQYSDDSDGDSICSQSSPARQQNKIPQSRSRRHLVKKRLSQSDSKTSISSRKVRGASKAHKVPVISEEVCARSVSSAADRKPSRKEHLHPPQKKNSHEKRGKNFAKESCAKEMPIKPRGKYFRSITYSSSSEGEECSDSREDEAPVMTSPKKVNERGKNTITKSQTQSHHAKSSARNDRAGKSVKKLSQRGNTDEVNRISCACTLEKNRSSDSTKCARMICDCGVIESSDSDQEELRQAHTAKNRGRQSLPPQRGNRGPVHRDKRHPNKGNQNDERQDAKRRDDKKSRQREPMLENSEDYIDDVKHRQNDGRKCNIGQDHTRLNGKIRNDKRMDDTRRNDERDWESSDSSTQRLLFHERDRGNLDGDTCPLDKNCDDIKRGKKSRDDKRQIYDKSLARRGISREKDPIREMNRDYIDNGACVIDKKRDDKRREDRRSKDISRHRAPIREKEPCCPTQRENDAGNVEEGAGKTFTAVRSRVIIPRARCRNYSNGGQKYQEAMLCIRPNKLIPTASHLRAAISITRRSIVVSNSPTSSEERQDVSRLRSGRRGEVIQRSKRDERAQLDCRDSRSRARHRSNRIRDRSPEIDSEESLLCEDCKYRSTGSSDSLQSGARQEHTLWSREPGLNKCDMESALNQLDNHINNYVSSTSMSGHPDHGRNKRVEDQSKQRRSEEYGRNKYKDEQGRNKRNEKSRNRRNENTLTGRLNGDQCIDASIVLSSHALSKIQRYTQRD